MPACLSLLGLCNGLTPFELVRGLRSSGVQDLPERCGYEEPYHHCLVTTRLAKLGFAALDWKGADKADHP